METTEGFYKFENDNWQYAPNFVHAPNYLLLKEEKNKHEYPIDGWKWYDKSPITEEVISTIIVEEDTESIVE